MPTAIREGGVKPKPKPPPPVIPPTNLETKENTDTSSRTQGPKGSNVESSYESPTVRSKPPTPTIPTLTQAQQDKLREATFVANQKWLATNEGTRAVERYQEPYIAEAQKNKPKPRWSVTYINEGKETTVTFGSEEEANRFSEKNRGYKSQAIPGPGAGPVPGSLGYGSSQVLTNALLSTENWIEAQAQTLRNVSSQMIKDGRDLQNNDDRLGSFVKTSLAGASRFGAGVVEGATFVARPVQWGKTVSSGIDLVKLAPGALLAMYVSGQTNQGKYRLGGGPALPGSVGDTVNEVLKNDPLLVLELAGGIAGGYASDKLLFGRKPNVKTTETTPYRTKGRGAPDFPEPPQGFPEVPPADFPEPPQLDTRRGAPNFPEPPTGRDPYPLDFPEPPLLDTRRGAPNFPDVPTGTDPYPLDFPDVPRPDTRRGAPNFPEPPTGRDRYPLDFPEPPLLDTRRGAPNFPDVPTGTDPYPLDFPDVPRPDTRRGAPNFPDAYNGATIETPRPPGEVLADTTFGEMTLQQKIDYYRKMGLTQTNAELSAKYADPLRSPMIQGMVDVIPDQTELLLAIEADASVMPRALGLGVTQDLGIGPTSSIGATLNLYQNTVQGLEGPSVQELQEVSSQGTATMPEMAVKDGTIPLIVPLVTPVTDTSPDVETSVDTASDTGTMTTPDQGQGEGTTPDQGQGEGTTPDQGQGEGTTPDQGQGEGTTPDQGQGEDTDQDQKQRQKMKDKDKQRSEMQRRKVKAPGELEYLVKFRYMKKSETLRIYAKSYANALSKALQARSTNKTPVETVITKAK